MADFAPRIQGAGLPPGDGTTYNPLAEFNFPPGTPVCPSTGKDGFVQPGQANDAATLPVVALASIPGVTNEAVLAKFIGPLDLTEAQWDVVTGGSGGLTLGATYYLSAATSGRITSTAPVGGGTFVLPLGTALSSTTLMIQVGTATEN